MRDFLLSPIGFVIAAGVVGFFLFGGLAWTFTNEYEKGGYASVHRRPKVLEPWHVEPVPLPEPAVTETGRILSHHSAARMGEATTNLSAYAPRLSAARSMIPVPVSRQPERTMIEDGYHTWTGKRLQQIEDEDVEEEGGEDRECGEDEGRPFPYGEESRAHAGEAWSPVDDRNVSWFRNTITGEIVMVDEWGRRIEFDDGSDARYPS